MLAIVRQVPITDTAMNAGVSVHITEIATHTGWARRGLDGLWKNRQLLVLFLISNTRTGNDTFQPVHLPDIPCDDVYCFVQYLFGREFLCAKPQDVPTYIRGQDVLACKEQVVALPLIAVDRLQGDFHPFIPFLRVSVYAVVFIDNSKFAVEYADTLKRLYLFACYGVITTCQIGCFAAGNFHAYVFYIVAPCLTFGVGKKNRIGVGSPSMVVVLVIEDIFAPEPRFINEVVLPVAYP